MYLRKIKITDVDDIHEYASIPEVSQYQVWGPNQYRDTLNHVKELLGENDSLYHRVIVINYKVIGAAEFHINQSEMTGEIGYVVHPDYQGKGIAGKVSEMMLDYGFSQLNLKRIIGKRDTRNIASRKLLEKIGMSKTDVITKDLLLSDGYRDTVIYMITEEAYKKRPSDGA